MVLQTIPLETPVVTDLRTEKILLTKANHHEPLLTSSPKRDALSSPGLQRTVASIWHRVGQLSELRALQGGILRGSLSGDTTWADTLTS